MHLVVFFLVTFASSSLKSDLHLKTKLKSNECLDIETDCVYF